MMKKKKCCKQLAGLLPIFNYTGSRYSKLYRDIGRAVGAQGQAGLGHDTASHAHDTVLTVATLRPRVGTTRPAESGHDMAGRVRAWPSR